MVWQPGDVELLEARVVNLEEVCAGKLCALLDRSMLRDLYDVNNPTHSAVSCVSI
jgi:predicted nucleotidyltransferase component of viral defense system